MTAPKTVGLGMKLISRPNSPFDGQRRVFGSRGLPVVKTCGVARNGGASLREWAGTRRNCSETRRGKKGQEEGAAHKGYGSVSYATFWGDEKQKIALFVCLLISQGGLKL